MIKFLMAASAVALSAGAATAGGFERSGLPIGFMFEKGNYAELSYGYVNPKVSGTAIPAAGGSTSGDVALSYSTVGLAFKTDLSDKLSLGLSLDPTFGADVDYPTTTAYPIRGSRATLRGDTIALIARYKFSDQFSVHGGLRSVSIGGDLSLSTTTITGAPLNFYRASFGNKRDTGFLLGAAFEKPEIALRVALTYQSETKHTMPVSGTVFAPPGVFVPFTDTTTVKLPQSLTLDFQSGVAADTLVFGSIKWADWTTTVLNAPNAGAANPLVSYANDSVTYNIGIGRKFSDSFSGAISFGYEAHKGGIVGNLGPTDGVRSVQIGGTYTRDNMKISAGVRYIDIGDATALGGASNFAGNSAVAVGMKVGFTF